MKKRMDYYKADPNATKGLMQIEKYVASSELDKKLYHLVKLRASQINGCAYCVDMHAKDARKAGETNQRLDALVVWWETSFYSDKERAALAWTEALTVISENDVSDELYEEVSGHFEDKELMALTMAIIAINSWNRLAIPFKSQAGTYNPDK